LKLNARLMGCRTLDRLAEEAPALLGCDEDACCTATATKHRSSWNCGRCSEQVKLDCEVWDREQ